MTFTEYFSKNVTPVQIRPKKDSTFMKFLGGCLSVVRVFGVNVPNKKEFMENYTTTIGDTIYSDNWPEEPTELVVHELCHVLQFKEKYMRIRYMTSPFKRMVYESECVQTEILCFPDRSRGGAWMERRIRQFVGYGINEGIVRRLLRSRIEAVVERETRPEGLGKNARRVHEAYLAWRTMENE